MKKHSGMTFSTLICPVCGKPFPIMRNYGRQRERGHIKDIWCPYCKQTQKMSEVRAGDYYKTNNIYM